MSTDNRGDLVDVILDELLGRSGFDDWWYGIDTEIREGIAAKLREIVDRHGQLARQGGDLTADQLVQACENIGYDLTCGACAAVFYTGIGGGEHTCGNAPGPVVIEVP